jgi:hypothetical protein
MKRCKYTGNGNTFLNFASLMLVCSLLPAMAGGIPHNPGTGGTFVPTPPSSERGTAVTNLNTLASFPDIQSAINAATAGDTLQVNSGASPLSTGLVMIDRSLTIQGETGSVVVLANTSTMGPQSGNGRAWFMVSGGVSVTIQDLIFDGNNPTVRIVDGFRINPGNSGTFNRCIFRNIEYLSDGGDEIYGFAITTGGVADVTDCTFMDMGIVGLFYFGSGVNGSLAMGNTFRGQGIGPVIDYGMEVGGGAVVTAMNNDFADNRGTYDISPGGPQTSAGIFVSTFFGPGTSLTATSNAFSNNSVGILVGNTTGGGDTSSVTAHFNTFIGNTDAGVDSDSSSTVNAENNWWGCSAGPATVACDGYIDNVDANPWLVLTCTLDPNPVEVGMTGTVTGDLTINSNGVDTFGLGFVPDGTIISFEALGGGVINPSSGGTVNGSFSATYTAFGGPSVTIVCAVNGVPDGPGFEVTLTVPTLGEIGMIAFVLLLATAAVVMMHKHRRMAR